jgi:hypothetical protein
MFSLTWTAVVFATLAAWHSMCNCFNMRYSTSCQPDRAHRIPFVKVVGRDPGLSNYMNSNRHPDGDHKHSTEHLHVFSHIILAWPANTRCVFHRPPGPAPGCGEHRVPGTTDREAQAFTRHHLLREHFIFYSAHYQPGRSHLTSVRESLSQV